jgi:hypothetical protein
LGAQCSCGQQKERKWSKNKKEEQKEEIETGESLLRVVFYDLGQQKERKQSRNKEEEQREEIETGERGRSTRRIAAIPWFYKSCAGR